MSKTRQKAFQWLLYSFSLGVVIWFTIFDAAWRIPQIDLASRIARESLGGEPLPGERQVVLPASSMDARWWVIHTERMLAKGEWRVRHSELDNFPNGRSVHWSSLPMWGLAGLSRIFPAETGNNDSVQQAAKVFGPVSFVVIVTSFSLLIGLIFGPVPAAVFCLATLASAFFVRAFVAGEADHHGIVAAFSMAGVLAAAAGARSALGQSPLAARRFFILSGVAGACGLWVSASSQIPVLIGTGLAALAAAGVARRGRFAGVPASLWEVWGISGGATSLLLYLVEYFPDVWHMRLEINHPFYSVAWVGAGSLIGILNSGIERGNLALALRNRLPLVLAAGIVAALPVVIIAAFGKSVFLVSDPFLLNLHEDYIKEFQSMWSFIGESKEDMLGVFFQPFALLVAVTGILLFFSRKLPAKSAKIELALVLVPALLYQALAIYQVRWSITAAALWIGAAVVVTHVLLSSPGLNKFWRWIPGILLLATVPELLLDSYASYRHERDGLAKNGVPYMKTAFFPKIVAAEVAGRIRRSEPGSLPVILSGPSTSTDFAYAGGVPVLGTLYWENRDGLLAAAELHSETDEAKFHKALLDRKITHIVVFSWDSFAGNYVRLDRGLSKDTRAANSCLIAYLAGTRKLPDWLTPLPYEIPDAYALKNAWVRIYKVSIPK